MANDVLVHVTGESKRKIEAALGYQLTPASNAGDLFRVPAAVAELIGEFPEAPSAATDSARDKAIVQSYPLDPEALDSEAVHAGDKSLRVAAEDASRSKEDREDKSKAESAEEAKEDAADEDEKA